MGTGTRIFRIKDLEEVDKYDQKHSTIITAMLFLVGIPYNLEYKCPRSDKIVNFDIMHIQEPTFDYRYPICWSIHDNSLTFLVLVCPF